MKKRAKIETGGDPLTMVQRSTPDHCWGYFDPATGTIAIEKDQPEEGKVVILIHELLHTVAEMLRQQGTIKRQPQHAFITGAAPMLAYLLASCGVINGVTGHDVRRFMERLDARSDHAPTAKAATRRRKR